MLGEHRAEYGANAIKKLSKRSTEEYDTAFSKTNLYSFYNFYNAYSKIFHSLSGKSSILYTWHTIGYCYKWKIEKHAIGMKMKQQMLLGILERFKEIYLLNIIIDY